MILTKDPTEIEEILEMIFKSTPNDKVKLKVSIYKLGALNQEKMDNIENLFRHILKK